MKTKAIFFDKDGTLIDFDAIWVPVSYNAIGNLLKKIGKAIIDKTVTEDELKAGIEEIIYYDEFE